MTRVLFALCLSAAAGARPAFPQPPPGAVVDVSPGGDVTPADLQAFHATWMTPGALEGARQSAAFAFTHPFEPEAWGTGQRMEAMVRMYDLTHDRAYLDHLRELAQIVVTFRDDRRTDHPAVPDAFRRRVMPAWGASRVSSGYLHHTGVDIAGVYAYPVAAFARIVSEHPPLWSEYGADAILFANAALETLDGFAGELKSPAGASDSLTYVYPASYRTLLTRRRCDDAYQDALDGIGPDAGYGPGLSQLQKNCHTNRQVASSPAAHNQSHALLMAMIEAWRAVDSAFYKQRDRDNPLAVQARAAFPGQIARSLRWFTRQARTPDGAASWLNWHGADGQPSKFVGTEDTSHAELSMRYLGVLHRSAERLNRALPPGQPRIDLTTMRRQLRSTFLTKVARGQDLAHLIDGKFTDSNRQSANGHCNGWLDLTGDDGRVYEKCRRVTLRVVGGAQPYLGIGNHASLLANKPTAPAPGQAVVPDVLGDFPTNAAKAIRAAGLVPRITGNGLTVTSQTPVPGTVVARGSTVRCTAQGGTPQ